VGVTTFTSRVALVLPVWTEKQIRRAIHRSVCELKEAVARYITYLRPFVWTNGRPNPGIARPILRANFSYRTLVVVAFVVALDNETGRGVEK
jgi:hypothetical protein